MRLLAVGWEEIVGDVLDENSLALWEMVSLTLKIACACVCVLVGNVLLLWSQAGEWP